MKTIRELRVLVGPHWRLPVQVFWIRSQDLALVRLGDGRMPLLTCWRESGGSLLNQFAIARIKDNLWSMTRAALDELTLETDESDGERLVEWIPSRNVVPNPLFQSSETCRQYRSTRRLDARRDFFTSFLRKYSMPYLRCPESVELLWHLLMTHAMEWLLNEQKPIDLIFCQIYPVPWTAGWQERFYQRRHWYRLHWRMLRILASGRHRSWSEKRRLPLWRLEVRPEKRWWKTALTVEQIRRRKLRKKKFAKHINESVKRSMAHTVDLFGAYCAEKRQVAVVGGHRLTQDGSSPGGDGGLLVIHRRIDGTVARARWEKPGQPEPVAAPHGKLPPLPDLPPQGRYVREKGKWVYEFGVT